MCWTLATLKKSEPVVPTMDEVTRAVAQQYDAYTYPAPVRDLAHYAGKKLPGDPSYFPELIWPDGRPSGPLSILVAGC
jgi:hypothetical protein